MIRRLGQDAGYTLIELVVVLLLAGLIGIAVAGGLQFGTRIWERSDSHVEKSLETASVQTVLRTLLASAIPRQQGGFVTFRGERYTLAFDAPSPTALGSHGLAHIDVALEQEGEGARLRLTATSLIDPKTRQSAVLAEHLTNAQFSYCDGSEKLPVWLAYWRDRDRLPDAIRLSGGAAWPALTIRLPITQDANCAFDPVSMTCRRS